MEPEDLLKRALPDIGRAGNHLPRISGQEHFEVVIGTDDRQPAGDTRKFPASAIAQLVITGADGTEYAATGSFIAPRTLLTAAHALYIQSDDPGRRGKVREVIVVPGRIGTTYPFGFAKTSNFYIPAQWISSASIIHDYALVFVPPGPAVGQMHPTVATDAQLRGSKVFIAGYPLDKPLGTQWFDTREIRDVSADQLLYDVDTAEGQSGAAIFSFHSGTASVVGIHRYGRLQGNLGIRMTTAIYNDITPHLV